MALFGTGAGLVLPGIAPISYASGNILPPALTNYLVESGATGTGALFLIPFSVRKPTNVDAVIYRNNDTSANGQKVRCGLMEITTGLLATLLQAASERTLTASAATNVDTFTSTQLVPGKAYAAGLTFDSSTVIARIDNDNTATPAALRSANLADSILFSAYMTPSTWIGGVFGVLTATHVYGAIPATIAIDGIGTSTSPYCALRVA